MGTRNLTMVYSNGEYKVAQYGQWDGYPEGLGCDLLNFLRVHGVADLKLAIEGCTYLSNNELYDIYKQNDWLRKYPELSRDTCGEIVDLIAFKNKRKLCNSINFAADGSCGWAYVIDLDKNTFEVYAGYNTEPLDKTERFEFLMPISQQMNEEVNRTITNPSYKYEYYPVKFVVEYDLDNLPENDVFINQVNKLTCEEDGEE